MTSNLNFDMRPILQLFVTAVRAVSQPHNNKEINKNGHASKFMFEDISWNCFMKIIFIFC